MTSGSSGWLDQIEAVLLRVAIQQEANTAAIAELTTRMNQASIDAEADRKMIWAAMPPLHAHTACSLQLSLIGCTLGIQREKIMLQPGNGTPKERRLSIRATEPQKAILAQAARARRTNVSQFVLQASLDAANAILVDQTEFRLPPDQWDAFCQRLDAPPKAIPELRQLFSEPELF